MFSRITIFSLLLAAFANGLAIRRDDGYYSSTSSSVPPCLPTVTPGPILLPDSSISLSLPLLYPSSMGTPTTSLPSPTSSLPLSVVTTTVTVYPTQCPLSSTGDLPSSTGNLPSSTGDLPSSTGDLPSSTGDLPSSTGDLPSSTGDLPSSTGDLPSSTGDLPSSTGDLPSSTGDLPSSTSVPPATSPSGVPNNGTDTLPQDNTCCLSTPAQPTPTPTTPPQDSPLNLPPLRRDSDSVVAQMRALEQQVMSTWVSLGKGNEMLSVIGEIENLIAQAVAPGANLDDLLQQAQALVNNS